MPSEEFEPAIPAMKQLQTYASDCIATAISIGLQLLKITYKYI
jgi:hypothetical protein